ncbi:MAG TPA: ABC transporter permease, partial [Longimicrobium sp.]|nr:ABC transporter permease [Longimicrobium sp.]
MRASPDVESAPPEPISANALSAGAARPAGAAATWIVSAMLAWGFLLALIYLSSSRLFGMGRGGRIPLDMYVAAASLLLLALAVVYVTGRRVIGRNAPAKPRGDGQWSIASRHFRKNKLAMLGLGVMILLYVITLLTPLIAPFDPAAQGDIVLTRNLEPSLQHLMGTDKFGRDIFSRVLYGSRISLTIGFIAVGISISLGTLAGALAGYFGGFVDGVIMRLTDMMLSFPRLVLLIVVIALFNPSIWLVVVVL